MTDKTRRNWKQSRYLSQAIQLEEAVNPHIVRATMSMVALAVMSFTAWAALANINEVARTPGEVVPQGYEQIVQHLEGGIVKAIHAQEGAIVDKGEMLLLLDDSGLREDLTRAEARQTMLEMQEERLRAFMEGRDADFTRNGIPGMEMLRDQEDFFIAMRNAREGERKIIEKQVTQRRDAIRTLQAELSTARNSRAIAEELYTRREELNSKGYASDILLLESRRALNEVDGQIKGLNSRIAAAQAELTEFTTRLSSLSAQHIDEASVRLDQTVAEEAQNREVIRKLEDRIARLQIRAPTRGLVKGLAVNTIGAIARPGETLLEIVPLDRQLEVQVKISPQDIGHLKPGQTVQVKFSTFDFSRYGSVPGRLEQISATTFKDEAGGRYYQGRIILSQNHVGDDPDNLILPGMTVMADIVTGDKTILQYLLKPVHRALKTAFRER